MFGLGKEKERIEDLEIELENSVQRNSILQEKLKKIEENTWFMGENTKDSLRELAADQDKMDGCLTEVVSIVKNQENGQIDYSVSQIESVIEQIEKENQTIRDAEKQISIKLQKQKETSEKIKNEFQKIEAPKKDLQEQMERSTSETSQMQSNIKKLQETAKMMSALSLNAAIEAGRLGESGKGFLTAAEDVRKQTEEYQQGLGILQQEIIGMERRMNKMAGSLKAMEDMIRDHNENLQDAGENTIVSELSEMTKQMTGDTQRKTLQVVLNGLQKWSKVKEEEKQSILGKIEEIGEIFLEEQKSRNAIENQISMITENMDQKDRSRENE